VLTIDNREKLRDRDGLHVLIVGVSEYPDLPEWDEDPPPAERPKFGMRQLTRAALSAYRVFEWLVASEKKDLLSAPLATCRLLLSPSPEEAALITLPSECPYFPAKLEGFMDAARGWQLDAAFRAGKRSRGHPLEEIRQFHGVLRVGLTPLPNPGNKRTWSARNR
jgi:hypothetical protein